MNDGDTISTLPFAETETMIKGVYAPERFLEIFRITIYLQGSNFDSDEVEIVCRYPQFFAARSYSSKVLLILLFKKAVKVGIFWCNGMREKLIQWLFLPVSLHCVIRYTGNRVTDNYPDC